MNCEVRRIGNNVKLIVDGQVVNPIAYMTYNPNKENYASFSRLGVNLFSFGVYLGDQGINIESGIKPFRRGFYKSTNEYDFSEIDKDLERITSSNTKAYIIPRIYIDSPKWWEKENTDELALDAKGNSVRQSYASKKWRRDTLDAIFAFIDHINSSKWVSNVIGYQVAAGGTEEWQYHHKYPNQYIDYSQCNLINYISWLKSKYGEIEVLNNEWNSKCTNFEEIKLPTPFERSFSFNGVLRDVIKEKHVIDFYTYHSYLIADTILFFCKRIKEYTDSKKLTGAFYGYVCEIMSNDYGHCGIDKVLSSKDIDFLASPNSYMEGRSPGIDWPYMSIVDSARLHGKLWFIESDTRTSLTTSLKEAMPEAAPKNSRYAFQGVWRGPSKSLSLSHMKKGFGKVLTGKVGTWWFDMWGGWFNDPEYLEFIESSTLIMENQLKEDVKTVAQVAVFIDPDAFHYFRTNHPVVHELIYNQRKSLGLMGAPYHIYSTNDISSDTFDVDKYKLYIFLNNVHIKESTKKSIEDKVKKGNRTLLWVYLQDYISSSPSITDFNITYVKEASPIQAEYNGAIFPSALAPCPKFSEGTLEEARVIATQKDSNIPVCAFKCFNEYTSVYCTVPGLPANLLTDIANLSGVHIYCYSQDVIYADSRYIFIHARTGGEKRIHLPFVAEVYEALSNTKISEPCTFIDFNIEQYDTKIFKIKRCEV